MGTDLTEVAPGVLVTTAEMYTTNTTVVTGQDGRCLVIDPAVTVADLEALTARLDRLGLAPAAGFATHSHWDHVLWSAALGDVPRYATPRTVEAFRRRADDILAQAEGSAPGHDPGLIGALESLSAGTIPWDGPTAQVVSHDGHAPGHAAVFLPGHGVLVAGDMCSDIEMPLLDLYGPDPLGDYRAGLELLAALPVRRVIPGHGHPGDEAEFHRRIAADTRYLDALERGQPVSDPRLTQDWLREAHAAQVRRYQA